MNILRVTLVVGAALLLSANAQAATIIDGATGDGDFQFPGTGSGPLPYTSHPNWFNAQGFGADEGINFSNTTQMGGSSQANSRGGMPFNNRTQVNNTGHTIAAAGEVFSLMYDFGAGGPPANWNGDETMRTFLFTASATVDGNITTADMTELGGDNYPIDRANDGQWTTRTVPVFYTSTAADVGSTVYFGMQFLDASGNTLFPRIDVVKLEVTAIPEPATLGLLSMLVLGAGLRQRRRK